MKLTLDQLIERARAYTMSPEEKAAQVRSFAYGNVKLHNPAVTREGVATAMADRMTKREREAANRESGYYWVKCHRDPDAWRVAYWDKHQSWWVTIPTPGGPGATDARWSTIGPRIPEPDR